MGVIKMLKKLCFNLILISCLFLVGQLSANEKTCQLCKEGKGISQKHTELYGNIVRESNIILKTENFFVAIDNYPVFEDHLLIIPKKHYFSFSVIEESYAQELDDIIYSLKDLIGAETFGLFEHGSNEVDGKQKLCGNSIYHAHLHFVPNLNMSQKELSNLLCLNGDNSLISLKNNSDITAYIKNKPSEQSFLRFFKELPTKGPYLFCYFSDMTKKAFCIPDKDLKKDIPSQFFRKLFAEYFKEKQKQIFWDWKNPSELENSNNFRTKIIVNTLQKFKDQNNEVFEYMNKQEISPEDKVKHYCLFCNPPKPRIWIDGKLAFALIDDYPVTPYHCLVITKRHVDNFFDLTDEELCEIKSLLCQCKEKILKEDPHVEGFNIGVNNGKASGQSIFHLHVHLIPRRWGDIENPRGGIRGIIPGKRDY
jgi:diadenosine tetraphosphate (Ap4A) HIT family hydrolase